MEGAEGSYLINLGLSPAGDRLEERGETALLAMLGEERCIVMSAVFLTERKWTFDASPQRSWICSHCPESPQKGGAQPAAATGTHCRSALWDLG